MPWLQLRFNYNATTIRLRCITRTCFHSMRFDASKKWTCQFFVVVMSQSNRTEIVISITSVVVECVVVSSYHSRIVFESQLWYRLKVMWMTERHVLGVGGSEQEGHYRDQVLRQTTATCWEGPWSCHDTPRQRTDLGRGQTTARFRLPFAFISTNLLPA